MLTARTRKLKGVATGERLRFILARVQIVIFHFYSLIACNMLSLTKTGTFSGFGFPLLRSVIG